MTHPPLVGLAALVPSAFAFHHARDGAPTHVRAESLQGRAARRREAVIASGPITQARGVVVTRTFVVG
jgi:hypothetical protein